MNCNLNNKIVYFYSHAVNTHSNEDSNTHGIYNTLSSSASIYIYIYMLADEEMGSVCCKFRIYIYIYIYIHASIQVFPTQFHFPKSTVFPSVCNRSNICDSVHLILCDSDTSLVKTDGVSVSYKISADVILSIFQVTCPHSAIKEKFIQKFCQLSLMSGQTRSFHGAQKVVLIKNLDTD